MNESTPSPACSDRHKILILDNSLEMGGLEKKLVEFVGHIDKEHFEIVVCCLKGGGYFKGAFEELGVRFYDGLLRHRYDALAYGKLRTIIKKEKIELIYTFLHPNTIFFSFLARVSGLVRVWVVSVHATGSASSGRLARLYIRPLLGKVDRFIAVARAHKEYLVEKEGLPEEKIEVIRNGVDVEKYHPGPPSSFLKRQLGIGGGEKVITTVSSLKPPKGVDILLRAAAGLESRERSVKWLIVGQGPEGEALRKMAAELGLDERVAFLGVREDVEDILRMSDIFVLPSRTEALPNVVLEAMASGLPVVTTDVGSVRELVEEGRSALVVPPGEPGAIRDALGVLLEDEGKALAFGARGRRIVEDRFTLGEMCARREKLFAGLLCGLR